MIRTERVSFAGAHGYPLAARLDFPEEDSGPFALFAHCFTCSKDYKAVARISHFPHAMSSLTADVSLKDQGRAELAGGGFRDTTRVASGDPAMWAEIMMENKEALSVSLEEVREQIGKMLDQLANSDKEGLQAYLAEVKARKDRTDLS